MKGPAAATLYGSDASNGVIQIFTKKGRAETAPTWNFSVTGGYDRSPENYPTHLYPLFKGADGTQALDLNKTLIGDGPYQDYQVNVSGGANKASYFVSGGYAKEVGSIQPNDARRGTLRLNVAWQPTDKVSFEARSSYGRNYINSLQGGNNWTSLTGNASNGDPRNATKLRPYGEAWVSVADIQTMTSVSDANRYTGGGSMSYQASPAWLTKLTAGVDLTNDNKQRFFPYSGNFGSASVFNGEKDDAFRYYSNYSAEASSQYTFKLPRGIGSDFSIGGQGNYETEQLNVAVGKTYPGPGVSTVAAAAQTLGGETYAHTVNIGAYAQDRFSFGDRLYTTVGFRIDGNSAFGKNYGYQRYPKIDVAYNLGGLSWVPQAVSSFKLRGAWGKAGKTPGAFDQYQTYKPEAVFTNTPALTPFNPGNTTLAPEITTAVDVGFDAGFFGDRLGFEATYYRQNTNDAITAVTLPPSEGFSQSQKQNIGGIVNGGWETALNWLTVSTRDFDWHNDFRADGNKNKVTNLNGHIIGSNTTIRVGYPIQGIWMQRPVSFNADDEDVDSQRHDALSWARRFRHSTSRTSRRFAGRASSSSPLSRPSAARSCRTAIVPIASASTPATSSCRCSAPTARTPRHRIPSSSTGRCSTIRRSATTFAFASSRSPTRSRPSGRHASTSATRRSRRPHRTSRFGRTATARILTSRRTSVPTSGDRLASSPIRRPIRSASPSAHASNHATIHHRGSSLCMI